MYITPRSESVLDPNSCDILPTQAHTQASGRRHTKPESFQQTQSQTSLQHGWAAQPSISTPPCPGVSPPSCLLGLSQHIQVCSSKLLCPAPPCHGMLSYIRRCSSAQALALCSRSCLTTTLHCSEQENLKPLSQVFPDFLKAAVAKPCIKDVFMYLLHI